MSFWKWLAGFFEDQQGDSRASRKAVGLYWLLGLLTGNLLHNAWNPSGEAFWGLLSAVLLALGLITSEYFKTKL